MIRFTGPSTSASNPGTAIRGTPFSPMEIPEVIPYYAHYNGSSWGSVTQASNTIAYWVELERANDNTVHLAAHSWSGDFKTLVWDNSSWTTQPYLHSFPSPPSKSAN